MSKKLIIVLGLALFLFLGQLSCAKKSSQTPTNSRSSAHTLTRAQEKAILSDTRNDLKIIMASRDSTADLPKALAGQALKQYTSQIKADTAKGRIKIRVFDHIKLRISTFTKTVAGLTFDFTDRSYYIDKQTKQKITTPQSKKQRRLLAVKKVKGSWKIIYIFSTKSKSSSSQQKQS